MRMLTFSSGSVTGRREDECQVTFSCFSKNVGRFSLTTFESEHITKHFKRHLDVTLVLPTILSLSST